VDLVEHGEPSTPRSGRLSKGTMDMIEALDNSLTNGLRTGTPLSSL
jgi:hypothetical protein